MFSCTVFSCPLGPFRSEMCVFIQQFVQNKQNKKTVAHKREELKVLFTPPPMFACQQATHGCLFRSPSGRQRQASPSARQPASRHHPLRHHHRQPAPMMEYHPLIRLLKILLSFSPSTNSIHSSHWVFPYFLHFFTSHIPVYLRGAALHRAARSHV